jgi:hypothetical protein
MGVARAGDVSAQGIDVRVMQVNCYKSSKLYLHESNDACWFYPKFLKKDKLLYWHVD